MSFYSSCGTLSHERVGVSVLPVGAPLANEDGNVFVYTDTLGYAGRSDTLPTLADMQVERTGPNAVRITYDRRAGVVTRRPTDDAGTTINYVAIDRKPTGSGTPSSVQIGPPRQEIQQFQKLSVPERLTIYNARYDRSGHPPDTRLAGAFKDKPAETFDAIVADLPAGDFDRFMRYWPILYSISETRGFDICRARRFPVLEARTHSYRLDERQLKAVGPIELRGGCTLFGRGFQPVRKRPTT